MQYSLIMFAPPNLIFWFSTFRIADILKCERIQTCVLQLYVDVGKGFQNEAIFTQIRIYTVQDGPSQVDTITNLFIRFC